MLPSRYESFGTVILEAWAAGTPLVACAAQGPAAHIAHGVNGLLAPIDNPPALTDAIASLMSDAVLREKLAANGFETYRRDFTPEAVTAQWLRFYEGVLRDSPKVNRHKT